MAIDDADELRRFRRNIAAAALPELLAVSASVFDSLMELVIGLGHGGVDVKMVRALTVELRARSVPPRSNLVGTA